MAAFFRRHQGEVNPLPILHILGFIRVGYEGFIKQSQKVLQVTMI